MRGLRMLKLLLAGVCAAAGPGLATPAPAPGQTVDDAMAAAYRTNPQLLAARQQLRALDEGVPQALSGWRPTVMVNGVVGKARDVDRTRDPTNTFPAFNERSWRTPDSASVLVTQPLYRGGQTLAGVSQAENQIQAGRAALQSAEQQVLLAAATAHINLFRDQSTLDIAPWPDSLRIAVALPRNRVQSLNVDVARRRSRYLAQPNR